MKAIFLLCGLFLVSLLTVNIANAQTPPPPHPVHHPVHHAHHHANGHAHTKHHRHHKPVHHRP